MKCFFPALLRGLLPLGIASVAFWGCSSTDTTRAEPAAPDPAAPAAIVNTLENDALAAGQTLYASNCAVCHGDDGRKGLNGAHDLSKSNLTAAGRVYLVTNGLGKMPPFKGRLSEQEIEQVVAYSLTLR
ncbi:c-type cytochrome [Hymenobacter sp. BT491]|uniref:c-type cytochrome n=1 Tax=Hymenobacter sp. BT491 TaxID=2766779 RepID=UPI0016539DF7|nr:cytochrome c [Hymenobacter sp. BT491]MBC6991065.1 cytochrome c [Hymenobacter sp. BT491]